MQDRVKQSVVILATGGTIAGTAARSDTAVGYQAGILAIEALVAAVPPLRSEQIEVEQVAQMDSKDMDYTTWQLLVARVAHHLARSDVCGVVVTHGTDTLEETAYFLHRVLSPNKPLVLTASMRPSNALLADGPQNLLDSVRLAQHEGRGVLVCLLGRVYAADDVRKVNGYQLDAFRSGGDGVVGSMLEGVLHQVRDWPKCVPFGQEIIPADVFAWPRVALFLSHAGVCAITLDALCASGIEGLVIVGTGNGTIHCALDLSLRRAAEQGIIIWRSTRCGEEGVVGEAEWPSGGRLSAVQARIELMLQMMRDFGTRAEETQ
jgi:L-asparaginase